MNEFLRERQMAISDDKGRIQPDRVFLLHLRQYSVREMAQVEPDMTPEDIVEGHRQKLLDSGRVRGDITQTQALLDLLAERMVPAAEAARAMAIWINRHGKVKIRELEDPLYL